jgi:PKD repeat protein
LFDSSEGAIDSREWEIAGEPTSEGRNPIVRLTTAGEKTIRLTVRGPAGTDSVTKTITVHPRFKPVRLDVVPSALSAVAPLALNFVNNTTGDVAKWRWDFGDGRESNEKSPRCRYDHPGQFRIRVTAFPSDGTEPQTREFAITVDKPWPGWVKVIGWGIGVLLLAAVIGLLLRRWRAARLRLPVHYWVHDSNISRWFDFTRANESRELPGLPVRVRRVGSTSTLIAESLNGSSLLLPDGPSASTQQLGTGGRISVRLPDGMLKVIAVAAQQKPKRPNPPGNDEPAFAAKSDDPTLGEQPWNWEETGSR